MDTSSSSRLSRRSILLGGAAFAGVAALPPSVRAQAAAAVPSNKLARSSAGMVTSPHELASRAGLEVLQAGGNAIEAAIAIGAALCVTYPHFTGIGGDAFWVIGDRKGTLRTLSGAGQAAANPLDYSGSIPVRGPGSALTTAATIDTWDQAFEFSRKSWGGRQAWSALFKRAIEHAANGFPVTPSQRFWQEFRAKELGDWPGFAPVFMPGGRMPEVGQTFRQPQLARTLDRIATHGAREFYEGETAWLLANGL